MTISKEDYEKLISEGEVENILDTASSSKRFLNNLIDIPFYYLFLFMLSSLFYLLSLVLPFLSKLYISLLNYSDIFVFLFVLFMLTSYFIFFEYFWGFTPAKIFTKTKVVNEKGDKPTFNNILIRTLCRFIPFDAFSFLVNGVGWHDKISKTRVINNPDKKSLLYPSLIMVAMVLFVIGIFIYSMNNNENYNDTSDSKKVSVNYKGLSFTSTENWEIEKSVVEDDFSYQIDCEKKGVNNPEYLTISWLETEVELHEWTENTIEIMKENQVVKNAKFGEITNINFYGKDACTVYYNVIVSDEIAYCQIIAYSENGYSILLIKQAGSKTKLQNDFLIIEKSLKLKNSFES